MYSLYGNSISSSPVLTAAPATEPDDPPSFLYPTQTYFLPNLTLPQRTESTVDQNSCPVYLQLAANNTPISRETRSLPGITTSHILGNCLTATRSLKHSSWICCPKFNCNEVGSRFWPTVPLALCAVDSPSLLETANKFGMGQSVPFLSYCGRNPP